MQVKYLVVICQYGMLINPVHHLYLQMESVRPSPTNIQFYDMKRCDVGNLTKYVRKSSVPKGMRR